MGGGGAQQCSGLLLWGTMVAHTLIRLQAQAAAPLCIHDYWGPLRRPFCVACSPTNKPGMRMG